jgi:hypothetical protein
MNERSQDEQSRNFGPGFTPTFLYYFVSTSLVMSLVISKGMHLPIATGYPQQLGIVAGLIAGGLGGYFNRSASITVSAPDTQKLLKSLDATLTELRYRKLADTEETQDETVLVYERLNFARLFSGQVYLAIEQDGIIVATRFGQLRQIQKALGQTPNQPSK